MATFGQKVRRGWSLTKSSWSVITQAKLLLAVPFFGFTIIMALFVAYLVIGVKVYVVKTGLSSIHLGAHPNLWTVIYTLIFYCLASFISTFFVGVVAHNALKRFESQPVSIQASFRAAWRKRKPLAAFSLLNSAVGLLVSAVAERIPYGGRIAIWLTGATWSVANVFATPVIMQSRHDLNPLQASKRSITTLKKVWGEGATAQLAIGWIAAVAILGSYIIYMLLARLVYLVAGSNAGVGMATLAVGIVGLMIVLIVFGLFSTISVAALYYYAETGKAPEEFDVSVLRAGMTTRKARRIFSS